MATIDTREGDDTPRPEVYLKIWQWDPKSGFWILNTRIDRPHGPNRLSSIAFRPAVRSQDDLLLASVGQDGNIKTWRIRSVKTKSEGVEGTSLSLFRSVLLSSLGHTQNSGLPALRFGSVAKYLLMFHGPRTARCSPYQ